MKKYILPLGLVFLLSGVLLFYKFNLVAGLTVSIIGFVLFFSGTVIEDKEKKHTKETVKNSQLYYSEPMSSVEGLQIEPEKQKQNEAIRETRRAEYNEFMLKTKHLFFFGENKYGVRIESVRQDKESGEYYKVTEIATGRGIGFPPSDPEMILETTPQKISKDEMLLLFDKHNV